MSRKIDMDKLSDDDKLYLAQRGELPTDVMSDEDQRKLLDPEQGRQTLDQIANTGDVNLAGVTVEELEAELEKRREVQEDVNPQKLLKPEGKEAALAEETDRPYSDWSKAELSTEIIARNEQRPEDDQLHTGGTKSELIAVLEANDEAESEGGV